jgi:hypothetical protein
MGYHGISWDVKLKWKYKPQETAKKYGIELKAS